MKGIFFSYEIVATCSYNIELKKPHLLSWLLGVWKPNVIVILTLQMRTYIECYSICHKWLTLACIYLT
jgi:hypothetical protein